MAIVHRTVRGNITPSQPNGSCANAQCEIGHALMDKRGKSSQNKPPARFVQAVFTTKNAMTVQFFILLIALVYVECFRLRHTLQSKMGDSLLPEGFVPPETHKRSVFSRKHPKLPSGKPVRVVSVGDLKERIHEGYRVRDLDVRGDVCSVLANPHFSHPVLELLHKRKTEKSLPGQRQDDHRVAIAIEGGGMRGCVGAGMVSVRPCHCAF